MVYRLLILAISTACTGSDISVYGLLHQVDGRLSATFVVDGQPTAASNYTPFDGEQDSNENTWKLSQQFFHQDLAPGQHTLLVTLTDVSQSQVRFVPSSSRPTSSLAYYSSTYLHRHSGLIL